MYYSKIGITKGNDHIKSKTVQNVQFATTGIVIMDLNFKNQFVMVVMIC